MLSNSAVILLNDDGASSDKPLMLQDVLFAPVLRWVYEELRQAGIQRFFILSPSDWISDAEACCRGAEIAALDDPTAEERFIRFAGEAAGKLIVLPRPLWLSHAAVFTLTHSDVLPWESGFTAAVRIAPDQAAQYGFSAMEFGEAYAPGLGGPSPAVLPLQQQSDLSDLQYLARFDRIAALEEQGVRFLDRETAYIDPQVQVGSGTLILPNVILRGDTSIGNGCEIGPNTMIRDSRIGDRVTINASQARECRVGDDAQIGPWSNLRPGTVLGSRVHIGDFVELKNAVIGDDTWAAHLAYIGDADVGKGCNFGCGSMTVNYDGREKHRTTIKDHVFIGCNTNLIAPVTVESNAFTAAGTTVTEDVPPDTLAIGRSRQENKVGWNAERTE